MMQAMEAACARGTDLSRRDAQKAGASPQLVQSTHAMVLAGGRFTVSPNGVTLVTPAMLGQGRLGAAAMASRLMGLASSVATMVAPQTRAPAQIRAAPQPKSRFSCHHRPHE